MSQCFKSFAHYALTRFNTGQNLDDVLIFKTCGNYPRFCISFFNYIYNLRSVAFKNDLFGNDDGVFETPIGNIGVALCWEYVRSGTARRLLDRVDIVIGGSCWPGGNPEANSDDASLALLTKTPNRFARLLGVPVVHSNHVGTVQHPSHEDPTKTNTQYFLGEACIVDGYGKTISRLSYGDGEGIVVEEVTLGRTDASREPIPEGFWIPELPKYWTDYWTQSLTGDFRKYYEETARPACLKKWGTP